MLSTELFIIILELAEVIDLSFSNKLEMAMNIEPFSDFRQWLELGSGY